MVEQAQAGRLVWEFSRLSRVQHPRLARVRELLRIDSPVPAPFSLAAGALVLVSERALGVPLHTAFEAPAQAEANQLLLFVLRAALGVAEALTAVHDAGLVHCDVKPDNVLWDAAYGATLIDLGFARAPSSRAEVRGTPAYMAPELWAGVCTPAADVFALGALIFDALARQGTEHGSQSTSGTRALSAAAQRDVNRLRGAWPEPVLRLVASFLELAPELRVQDGRAALSGLVGLLRALGEPVDADSVRYAGVLGVRSPRQRAQDARTSPWVGHALALEQLTAAIDDALSGPSARAGLVVLEGPRGAGSSRLARESLRLLYAQRAQAGRALPTLVHTVAALERLRDVDCVVVLERPDEATLQEALCARAALGTAGHRLCVVVEGVADRAAQPALAEASKVVRLSALDTESFEQLVRRLIAPQALDAAKLRGLRARTQGLSGRLCEAVAVALLEGQDPLDAEALRYDAEAAYAAWPEPVFDLALWLAWSSEPVLRYDAVLQLWGGRERVESTFAELLAEGALAEEGEVPSLEPHIAQQLRALGSERWFQRFGALLEGDVASHSAFLLAASGRRSEAVVRFLREGAASVEQGRYDLALRRLREADALLDDVQLKLALAELERKRAHYGAALRVLEHVVDDGAAFLRSELARLAGDGACAERELLRLTAGVWAERAAAQRARLSYDTGDYAACAQWLDACRDSSDERVRVRAAEVAVLLALAQAGPEHTQVRELLARAERTGDLRLIARALGLKAYVEGQAGKRLQAILDLRRAVALAEQAGELHEYATFGLNLGLLELEDGQLGQAVEHLEEAAYTLAWIDRPADLTRVLYNLGSAALLLGDTERAEAVLAEAARAVEHSPDQAARAMVAAARSELYVRHGATEAAARLLEDALAQVPRELAYVRGTLLARTGMLQLLRGDTARAEALRGSERPSVPESSELAGEFALFDVQALLARGELEVAAELAEAALQRAGERVSFGLEVRLLLVASEVAQARGDEEHARHYTAACRKRLERALSGLPHERRARMRNVPEFARVLASGRVAAQDTRPSDSAAGSGRWRELIRGGRRLFSAARPRRIAKRLSELALDLVHAERALIVQESGEEFVVLAHSELAPEAGRERGFSRSVVRRAFLERAPVVSLEASEDERFERAQSLHAISVRSVLAVPLDGLGVRAALYLDDRLRASAFSEEDQLLLLDLCELARQALQAGSALVEERRRAQALGQQQRRAVQQLSELSAARVTDAALPFVGTSLALRRVTEAARKLAQTDVPLVIQGASGTGKELLARFIHAEGPRRAAGFVAENCAALPDAMLESALFGHVRGAFTGAERARRGLFELADGGSLLLDEVAEMSPAMQAKLLRVLQEGEFRALGSEKVKRVNVRVIAASHRNLAERVRAGLFREDLFYRLSVMTLELPALSERREDIPLLVRHFLEKHAAGREVRVSPAAMQLWEARDYPGNIRQLENEVRRALALAEHVIEPAHVQSPASSAAERVVESGFGLHEQTEALTRKLVGQAMERTRGNVSQAAQLLGISRFGLQKILRRLADEAH